MRITKKQTFILHLILLSLFGCETLSVDLQSKYKKQNFTNDFLELLENEKIDSITYFRGLILKNYADKNEKWSKTMKYEEIINWINQQTKISGNINQQLFENEQFEIIMNKEYVNSKKIDFKLDVRMKDLSQINQNDTLKFWISHQNLAGEQSSGMVVKKKISDTELSSKKIKFEYTHDLDSYKNEFPSWKYDNLKLVPDKYYGIFSNFKIIKYFLIRKDKMIYEVDLEEGK